jgi:putative tryptophan/tyrosine transport system substrate-binding protein
MMKRREFITLLGGAAAAWPLAAHPEQVGRVRRVGVLSSRAIYDFSNQSTIAVLRSALESLGWVEGRNLQLDIRFAGGDAKTFGPYVDELVALRPDVLVVSSNLATATVQQRTRTIPIVFGGVGDPVAGGLVKSLARPEGNTTGITNLYPTIGGKWLELLKDAVPQLSRVAVLIPLPKLFESKIPRWL